MCRISALGSKSKHSSKNMRTRIRARSRRSHQAVGRRAHRACTYSGSVSALVVVTVCRSSPVIPSMSSNSSESPFRSLSQAAGSVKASQASWSIRRFGNG
jgi:hypothetical protein